MALQDSLFSTIVQLNNVQFRNSLNGLSDADAHRQVLPECSSPIFIAGHLINARYYIAKLAGVASKRPFRETFTSFDPAAEYGQINTFVEVWDEVADAVIPAFAALTEEQLLEKIPTRFPVSPSNLLSNISFLLQPESYHIGQLGILRKALGYPATSYK